MDIEQMIRLVNTVSASNLTEFSYEESGMTVRLEKKQGKVVAEPSPAPEPEKNTDTMTGKLVTSPLVGVFYAAPSEDADAFVQVGDTVKKGQVLAIVEAMKLMNEIESDYDGTIAEILVKNGQAVEYGQPLFKLK